MFKKFNLVVVGAGLFGSVIAEQASRNGHKVAVIEMSNHIGGNCYTEFDRETGINIHKYGPHIFHTSNKMVWDYIQQFSKFNNYIHKAKSCHNGHNYSFPINLDTINSFYDKNFTPTEAEAWIRFLCKEHTKQDPANFEEQAIALVGLDLYNTFIRGYTVKQWDTDPKLLPASVARRLPVRFTYNDRYYNDTWEAIPEDGYTPIFTRMLEHENITVFLNTDWETVKDQVTDQLVVYTGPIDRYYQYQFGRLAWRTLDFEYRVESVNDAQGCTQINYPDIDVPWTREIEHKHFHPERKTAPNKTIIGREFSRSATDTDTPYYPVNTEVDQTMFGQYRELAEQEDRVVFGGRLGEYMYYDMHQVIGSALACYKNKIKLILGS